MPYVITTRDLPDQPVVSIRERHAGTALPAFLGRAFAQLFGGLARTGSAPAGHPFVIYHAFGAGGVDAEVCVPIVDPSRPPRGLEASVVPAATVASTMHVGPYEDLAAAYDALNEWARHNALDVAGPPRERYLDGPSDGVRPVEYRTEVELPVTTALIAAG